MSPRKRTPDKESTETTTATAEPSASEATTAVAEAPAPEADENGQSFADRVGQKKYVPAPDPFGLAVDNVAGVRLFESKQDRQMALKFGEGRFEDKPSQAVIGRLKEAGYRWNPSDRIWAHPVEPESAMTTRIEAKRLYDDVCRMIRQEKSIEPQPDLPF
jgi:hypothetical protein